ncbi:DUF2357 domain-containing protein [Shewanella gelidimarina]|uniref:DUF2357 domain-containing protein n=1 Tax=Shewanella gelidimarina TaxID=56813 RepID=UPI00200FE5EF|nr:DUF2357 domain-containing protein [Shewanella gelidimarina]MCL1058676.1 DUF2357 domain-containing protein [Shewanella gelidimarina]
MTAAVTEPLSDFGQLYNRYQNQEPIAKQLLQGQHRYLSNLTFDPLNGQALPQRMSHRLSQNILGPEQNLCDSFTHIIDHCMDAIGHILLSPRQTVVRVHEMTPVYLAQRLDSRSVQWLSRKPGNNMREKLAANPHILAATRKMSFDTLENRLLKALLIRVQGLLLYRQEAGLQLAEEQEGLLVAIQKTLRFEGFLAIKSWQHMPPNNVLLQDKQYRKVWRAWQLLQRLEEDCQRQQKDFVASGFGVFSELLKQLAGMTRCVLLDQTWQFKLDYLSVVSSLEPTEKLSPIELLAIDLGEKEAKGQAQIKPEASLVLSLSIDGHIRIQRRGSSGASRCWDVKFQETEGLISVRVISHPKSCTQNETLIVAMPADFPSLAKQLVGEILPGESKARKVARPLIKVSGEFVTMMIEGASYKLQLGNESATRSIGPQLLDVAGLDCSQSHALPVEEEVFSVRELTQINGDTKFRQLGGFSDQLASQFHAHKAMHYLVSDHHSEFETSDLRREINRNFNNATPLPKSIAAVYATLEKNQFKPNDLIMVLSSDNDGIYATPIFYCGGKKSREDYFERHPSIRLSLQGERQLLRNALVNSGLTEGITERFIELYSYREIVTNKAQLILQEIEQWYRIPSGLKVASVDVSDILLKESRALQKKVEQTFFISVSAAIKPQKGIKSTQWLAGNPLLGSQQLLQKQYERPNKVFWKDHLPQLMTRLPVKGIEQDFYFVDSGTSVKPERGVPVDIPIDTPFTLPGGKEELRFTVYQGKGSERQVFSLLLSLRKPLKTDCICMLNLSYTYGEEQPYKLRFIPDDADNKPFNYVDALWGKKQGDTDSRDIAIPTFPERRSFEELRAFQGNERSKDIVDWLEGNLAQMDNIYHFMLFGKGGQRFNFSYKDIDWIANKDFGFYRTHPDYENIFVHRSGFEGLDTVNQSYFSGDVLAKKDNKFSLESIGAQGELTERDLKSLPGRWRFPMLIFSDQERSFTDDDVPDNLTQRGNKAIKQAEELLAVEGVDKALKIELKQFLSYCHTLMPQSEVNDLLQAATDSKLLCREHLRFKYALGSVSQTWQQQLLQQILEPVDDSNDTRAAALDILSVAMWRNKTMIHTLTAEQVTALAERLNEYLTKDITLLKKKGPHYKWNPFILRLELLLGLLRTRESLVPAISTLFSYGSSLSNQLLNTVEKITDKQGEALSYQLQQPKVVARVKLTVNKPVSYHRTPDLLYGLKLYLSGEDGADLITITELVNSA